MAPSIAKGDAVTRADQHASNIFTGEVLIVEPRHSVMVSRTSGTVSSASMYCACADLSTLATRPRRPLLAALQGGCERCSISTGRQCAGQNGRWNSSHVIMIGEISGSLRSRPLA